MKFNFQFSIFNYLIVLLFLIAGMSACRSHKKATAPVRVEVEGAAFYASCYPIESLWVPQCKIEISVGGHSLNGSIYIRPDSVFYFRGKMVMDVVRGAIYRDSFIVVNYLDRKCYRGKNDYLQKVTGYPVNPESLMMLFTADRCEEAWRNKFDFIIAVGSNDQILMQGKNRNLLEININANTSAVEGITLYNNQQRQPVFSAEYGGYEQFPHYALPTVFDISAQNDENPIRIKVNSRQILFNQPQNVNVSVPSKYTVVVLE